MLRRACPCSLPEKEYFETSIAPLLRSEFVEYVGEIVSWDEAQDRMVRFPR